jgi:hypothetical protein
VSPEQRTTVQMSPEAQNDIKMQLYDFYQKKQKQKTNKKIVRSLSSSWSHPNFHCKDLKSHCNL